MKQIDKDKIIEGLCYTPLVFYRINKKLNKSLNQKQIETLVSKLVRETPLSDFVKTGKNIYVSNRQNGIRVTINSFTNRVITVDVFSQD